MAALLVASTALAACGDKDELGIDEDEDGFNDSIDCDDTNGAINPGAEELCDGIDNNCSGEIDDNATDGTTHYADGDGDGYGDVNSPANFCDAAASGYVTNADDCDDGSAYAFPGGVEVCDGLDNDCDGTADNDASDPSTFYADADGDGFGDLGSPTQACAQPTGYVSNYNDCDDTSAELNPDAVWYPDADFDGFGDSSKGALFTGCEQPEGYVSDDTDCNDDNQDIFPGAEEICDGADSNCDGKIESDDYDDDGDGQADCQGDCDDTDATVYEGGKEICGDGIDNDCTTRVDDACPMDASTEADWIATGENSSDYMGLAADVGDLNGDGIDDVVAGSYGYDEGSVYSIGRTYVFFGPLSGSASASAADVDITGGDSYDYFGYNVAAHGDANGDGYDDLVVNAYGDEGEGGSYSGTMYVFYGPLTSGSFDAEDADAELTSDGTSNYTGQYEIGFMDSDGDGAMEVFGNLYYGDDNTGAIAFFEEPDGYMIAEEDANTYIRGNDTYAYTGRATTVADFDGDGNDDFGWVEPSDSLGFIMEGPFSGELDGGDADVDITAGTTNSYLVTNMSAGDYNDDGYVDLAVGSMYSSYFSGSSYGGAVVVINGPLGNNLDIESDYDYAFYDNSYNYLGHYIDALTSGDIDGDGYDDLLVGEYSNDDAGYSSGVAMIQFGPLEGVNSFSNYGRAIYGSSQYNYVGREAAFGDVDGDGGTDVIVSGYGASSYYGQVYTFFNTQF